MAEIMSHIAAGSRPRPSADIKKNLKILMGYLTDYRTRILMYHGISNDTLDPWAVSPQKFSAQMSWIRQHGHKVQSLPQALMDARCGKVRRKSIVLTFDDGFANFLENAVPILCQYQWPATLFVVAHEVGGISRWQSNESQRPLLNWQEIRDIANMGYEIGSHGLYHRDLTTLCSKDLEMEITVSKKLIEDYTGASVNAFSYPWGVYGAREQNAVQEAGYDCAIAVGGKWENGPETNRFCLQRKTMCGTDSLADFARKVGKHEQLYVEARRVLGVWKRRALSRMSYLTRVAH